MAASASASTHVSLASATGSANSAASSSVWGWTCATRSVPSPPIPRPWSRRPRSDRRAGPTAPAVPRSRRARRRVEAADLARSRVVEVHVIAVGGRVPNTDALSCPPRRRASWDRYAPCRNRTTTGVGIDPRTARSGAQTRGRSGRGFPVAAVSAQIQSVRGETDHDPDGGDDEPAGTRAQDRWVVNRSTPPIAASVAAPPPR